MVYHIELLFYSFTLQKYKSISYEMAMIIIIIINKIQLRK